MQMYSVSARNLYRISPWYRLKPLYLIFRKTDRTGQDCPCPWLAVSARPSDPSQGCWLGPDCARTVAIIISLRSPSYSQSTPPGSPPVQPARRIRKHSQLAGLGLEIFSAPRWWGRHCRISASFHTMFFMCCFTCCWSVCLWRTCPELPGQFGFWEWLE